MQGMQWRQYDKVQKEENNTFNVIQTHTQKNPKKNLQLKTGDLSACIPRTQVFFNKNVI